MAEKELNKSLQKDREDALVRKEFEDFNLYYKFGN